MGLLADDVIACGSATPRRALPQPDRPAPKRKRLISNSRVRLDGLRSARGCRRRHRPRREARDLPGGRRQRAPEHSKEPQTVVHHRLPVKLIVLNNGGYLSMRQTQSNFFGRLIGAGPASGGRSRLRPPRERLRHPRDPHRSRRLPAAALDAAGGSRTGAVRNHAGHSAGIRAPAQIPAASRWNHRLAGPEDMYPFLSTRRTGFERAGEEDLGMALKNVIFDLDGTLVDSLPGIEYAVDCALRQKLSGPDVRIAAPDRPAHPRNSSGRSAACGRPEALDRLEAAFRDANHSEGWTKTASQPQRWKCWSGSTRWRAELHCDQQAIAPGQPHQRAFGASGAGLGNGLSAAMPLQSRDDSAPDAGRRLHAGNSLVVGDTQEDLDAAREVGWPRSFEQRLRPLRRAVPQIPGPGELKAVIADSGGFA